MSTETALAPRKPRLNPFAFPSDTDFRFVLLIVTVLAVSILYIDLLIANDIPSIQQKWADGSIACGHQVFGTNFDQLLNQVANSGIDYNTEAERALWDQYYACKLPFEIEKTLWVLGFIALLVGIATLLYWFFPAWKIRRDHLLPLTAEDAPEVVEFLTGLCREMELKQLPKFVWNPLNTTSSGLAFGRLGKYYVALSGGLVTQFYTDPSAFRAVLLHELSHLKNADVDKTYFATAIWQAFLLIIILPYASLHFSSLLETFLTGFITLIALVYLTRNSVLRSRELYADARADMLGEKHALETVLAVLPNQQGNILQNIKVHPAPSERRRMLFSSEGLFQSSFWVAVATGMAFSIMKGHIELLYGGTGVSLLAQSITSALLFALLVVGILGLGVWRSTFAKLILGNISIGKGRLAFGITLGILVDYFLGQTKTVLEIFLILFWSGILFLTLYALFHWIASTAETWLDVAASLSSPRRIYLMNLAFAVIISSTVFTWLLTNLWVIERTTPTNLLQTALPLFMIFGNLYVGIFNPFVLVALASLWAVPMAAWFWRKQAAPIKTASWAYLEGSPLELHSETSAQSLQPGFAIKTGLKLGTIYCAILLIIRVLVRVSGLGDVINGNDSYKLTYFYTWIVLAVLMQIGAAVLVSGKVKKIGWAHGLFAAFIGGCVMTVGILTVNSLFLLMNGDSVSIAAGGGLEPIFVWQVFSQVINFGTFFALIPAIAVSAWADRKSQNHI